MNTDSEIYNLTVNGQTHQVKDAWIGESLLYVLRERLGLPGSKGACEQGECGSCTVIMDGQAVCSCLVMAATAIDTDIRTVENLSQDGPLTEVQDAFITEGGVQCGFCTPGLVVAIEHLLSKNSDPSEIEIKEAISGNI